MGTKAGPTWKRLLIDNYPGSIGAWSICRKLSGEYTGNCIDVYEDGGASTVPIGFDGEGNLDINTLTGHTGANNGRVTKVYDQSGNANDLIVPTATVTDWPYIVVSGTVQKVNGKPAVRQNTDGTDFFVTTNGITGTVIWQFSVQEFGPSAGTPSELIYLYFSKPGANAYYMKMYKSSALSSYSWIGGQAAGASGKAATCEIYKDGSATPITNWEVSGDLWDELMPLVTAEQNLLTFSDLNLSTIDPVYPPGNDWRQAIYFGHQQLNGWPYALQEQVMWESDQAAHKTAIETNINDYYSIY